MKQAREAIEKQALFVGAFVNLFMACCGWYVFYLTGSQAILLDGNFSFIAVLTCLIGVLIIRIKHQRTEVFPLGLFFFESLYSLFKAFLMLGLIIFAGSENITKLITFFRGKPVDAIEPGPILIYSIVMGMTCFLLAWFYRIMNKKAGGRSVLLHADATSGVLDGVISFGIGIVFLLIGFVSRDGALGFLWYIGDSIMVLAIGLFFIRMPFSLLRHSFIELVGGSLQNKDDMQHIIKSVHTHLPRSFSLAEHYVSKSGSQYMVYLRLTPLEQVVEVSALSAIKQNIVQELEARFSHVDVEISIIE